METQYEYNLSYNHQCGDTKYKHWVLFIERVYWIDPWESLNSILPNYQSNWFMSPLCIWSFDLRHQRDLMNIWLYFDHDLRCPSHEISKISHIKYFMKSSKMLCGQDEIVHPWYLRRLTHWMRCKEILGQGSKNIIILNNFFHILLLTWVID